LTAHVTDSILRWLTAFSSYLPPFSLSIPFFFPQFISPFDKKTTWEEGEDDEGEDD
jgi:hypothetical protein